jgi:ketosteroid isomerase-like protein
MENLRKQVALKFLHAMGAGDAATVATCLAPDAITMARNFSKFAGVIKREQIVSMVGAFRTLMPQGLAFNVLSVTAEGDRVAIECDGDAITRSGEVYRNLYCFVLRFAGDLISEIHEYFCSKLADELIWPLVQEG